LAVEILLKAHYNVTARRDTAEIKPLMTLPLAYKPTQESVSTGSTESASTGTSWKVYVPLLISIYISTSGLDSEYFEGDVLNKSPVNEPGCCGNEHYPPELCPNYLLLLGTQ
jgi:hypothetical protein